MEDISNSNSTRMLKNILVEHTLPVYAYKL